LVFLDIGLGLQDIGFGFSLDVWTLVFGFSKELVLVFPDLEFLVFNWMFGSNRSINFWYKCRTVQVAVQSRF